jgi:hypothetical protein
MSFSARGFLAAIDRYSAGTGEGIAHSCRLFAQVSRPTSASCSTAAAIRFAVMPATRVGDLSMV